MKICVFGAGGVGGTLAVRLALAGADVSVVVRGANLEAIAANGLLIQLADGGELHARPKASNDPHELGVQDVVVFSVKHAALVGAIRSAAPMIGKDTLLIFTMNGLPWWFADSMNFESTPELRKLLDPSGELGGLIPLDRWVACAISSGNRIVRPGVVVNTTPTGNAMTMGYATPRQDPRLEAFAVHARAGGYRVTLTDRIRDEMWRKLLVNAGLGPVSTMTQRTHKETCMDPATRAVAIASINNILAVGKAIGIELEMDAREMTEPTTMPAHTTSFLQDLLANRPLEISNGLLAVRELSRIKGLSTPHLDVMAALMAARSDDAAKAAGEPASGGSVAGHAVDRKPQPA